LISWGLLVPVVFLMWAAWEENEARDRYKNAWQAYWMGRSLEASEPVAESRFLAAHPGIGEDRVGEILFLGGVATFTCYLAVFGRGLLRRRKQRAGP
jgi:hypothetical protein